MPNQTVKKSEERSERILPEIIDVLALNEGLYTVVSQAEAQRMWRKSQKALDWARWRGQVKARKSGRNWLITVASLVALYGQPFEPMEVHPEDAYFIENKEVL